mgnify:CR=1 FL=1
MVIFLINSAKPWHFIHSEWMQTEGDTGQYNSADYKLIVVQTCQACQACTSMSFDFIDAAIVHIAT